MRRNRRAAVLGLGIVLGAGPAGAYCRTTTCDIPNPPEGCTWDADHCATSGYPLLWPEGCAWFGVQKDGSNKSGISYDTLHDVIASAFSKWSKANCEGGAAPAFEMQDTDLLYGPVECPVHEFNKHAANASAWMFRDDSWPYQDPKNTIALTSVSVDLTNGRILDADCEINSFGTKITTSGANGADLEAIVTHEAGHFLGLAHSKVAEATMAPNYPGTSIRSLAPDDEKGICAVYPPGASPVCGAPEPIYGFSKYCGGVNPSTPPVHGTSEGCSCRVGIAPPGRGPALFGILMTSLLLARRRRRPSNALEDAANAVRHFLERPGSVVALTPGENRRGG
jgi:MYXO-CTERM domain-containing protein